MRSRFRLLAFAVIGAVLGSAATNHVWVVSTRISNHTIRSSMILEQEYLRGRAARTGASHAEVVHAQNVAELQAGIGLKWLDRLDAQTYAEWSTFPWEGYLLADEFEDVLALANEDRARKSEVREGTSRARAALALERAGIAAWSESEWERAESAAKSWDAEILREVSEMELKHEQHPARRALEDAYLEASSFEQLFGSLDSASEELLSSAKP